MKMHYILFFLVSFNIFSMDNSANNTINFDHRIHDVLMITLWKCKPSDEKSVTTSHYLIRIDNKKQEINVRSNILATKTIKPFTLSYNNNPFYHKLLNQINSISVIRKQCDDIETITPQSVCILQRYVCLRSALEPMNEIIENIANKN